MISRASGSLTAIRALVSSGGGPKDGVRRLLASRAVVRWGAISLTIGGAAGVASSVLEAYDSIVATTSGYGAVDERLYTFLAILHAGYTLLVSVGLLGVYAALTKGRRWVGRLAAMGALISVPSGLGFCAGALYELLAQPVYYPSWGISQVLSLGGYFGQPVGVVLLGVAALWTRGLGRWRVVPLAVGLIGSPLLPWVVFRLFLYEDVLSPDASEGAMILGTLLFFVPMVLAGLGWVAVGFALFGAREREAALLAKERRAKEEENLGKARRLYEEAWGAGNLSVADELAAPDFLDRRSGGGREAFKRAIADLRRTFPDLRVSVEGQTAEGDTVVTRCAFSGTDRGGFLYYPPTGKEALFTGVFHDRFADGRLAEHRAESDTRRLLQQLGLQAHGG